MRTGMLRKAAVGSGESKVQMLETACAGRSTGKVGWVHDDLKVQFPSRGRI